MRISFSPQPQIGLVNLSYGSNNNLTKNTVDNNGKSQRRNIANKNSMGKFLGGKLKRNNILENLMKQKENLMDSKNTIMERGLKNGENPKSIEEKLESIDKQIEEIDKQVNELQLEEQRKAIGTEDKKKKGKSSKQKTNKDSTNDIQTDRSMDNILSLSSNLSQAKALSSQKNIMSGDAKVLEGEIKIDKSRGINPVRKKKRLAEMKDNIEEITEKIGKHLKDVTTKSDNKIQNNTSNNIVDKSEQSKKINSSINTENAEKLLIKQQQIAQNIKQYIDNNNDKVEYSGEKINIVA
ncbi:hypothetical protein [Clostridium ganghwense]|uniref:Viral A-type inclusion protein n=1 Tax=Clostridium ganghwense TaxID=312089 RepID=A0ABT4CSI2_9CLOT|nr:hypothetical protein [Clostridium ganghwense]MCY6371156.1 hypothetical protein [Clostridium ganghwense]